MKSTIMTLAFAATLALGIGLGEAQEKQTKVKLKDEKQTKKEAAPKKSSRIKIKKKSPGYSNSLPRKDSTISNRLSTKSSVSSTSTVIQRLQRKPNGDLVQKSPTKKPVLNPSKKRMGVRFNSPSKTLQNKDLAKKTQSQSKTSTTKKPVLNASKKRMGIRLNSPSKTLQNKNLAKKIQSHPKTSTTKKPVLNASKKRMGVRLNSPSKSLQNKNLAKKIQSQPNPKRFAGKFKTPPSLGKTGTTKRPFTAGNPKRFAGNFQSPKSLLKTATSQRPNTTTLTKKNPPKSKFKMGGAVKKGVGGLAAVGVANGMLNDSKKNKQLLNSGKITKSQYKKLQTTNGIKTAGELYKLKKLNPATAVMNDVIGTDPISLGVEGIGDLINGTDNAKQSLKGMKDSWNKSLTKQAFTDPKGAGKRIKNGVKDTSKKIGNGIKKAGNKVGDFFKSKKKKRK